MRKLADFKNKLNIKKLNFVKAFVPDSFLFGVANAPYLCEGDNI